MGIEDQVEATLQGLGYELVEFHVLPSKGRISVFLDKEAGITLSDCELATRQLEGLFAAEGYDYTMLEVSSPGPRRRLSKLEHFRRFSGSSVQVTLKDALEDEKRKFSGVYELLPDGRSIVLNCKDGTFEFPLEGISNAKLSGTNN
jgi:ribosome maturation factor RimP